MHLHRLWRLRYLTSHGEGVKTKGELKNFDFNASLSHHQGCLTNVWRCEIYSRVGRFPAFEFGIAPKGIA